MHSGILEGQRVLWDRCLKEANTRLWNFMAARRRGWVCLKKKRWEKLLWEIKGNIKTPNGLVSMKIKLITCCAICRQPILTQLNTLRQSRAINVPNGSHKTGTVVEGHDNKLNSILLLIRLDNTLSRHSGNGSIISLFSQQYSKNNCIFWQDFRDFWLSTKCCCCFAFSLIISFAVFQVCFVGFFRFRNLICFGLEQMHWSQAQCLCWKHKGQHTGDCCRERICICIC